MSFIKLEIIQAHTQKTHNFLKRLRGARQALNLTHTHFSSKNNTSVSTPLPRLPAIGKGNFRTSGSGAIRIPCRAPKQCGYSRGRATNITKPLIRSLKPLSLAHNGFVSGSRGEPPAWNELRKKAKWLHVIAFSHLSWVYIVDGQIHEKKL